MVNQAQTNLLTMRVYNTGPAYDSSYKRHAFWDRVLEAIAEVRLADPGFVDLVARAYERIGHRRVSPDF